MNKKNIEMMIPIAMDEIENKFKNSREDGIESKYFGYVNSFGACVIQSGLSQTLTFYGAEGSEADRKAIANLFEAILKKFNNNLKPHEKLLERTLFINEKGSEFEKIQWKNRLLETNVALKLAMRTFKDIK